MSEILDMYNNIVDLESDMILNPDNYSEEFRKKCKAVIKRTEKRLRDLGYIIDEEGELKSLS
jgi:hypothetical protein